MADAALTVQAALADAQRQGLPRNEAQWLLAHVLGRPRAWLLAHDDATLTADQLARWQVDLAQRLDHMPLAYLTGEKEFHGLSLQITPAVLDPRPDTETLVDWALACLGGLPPGAAVLDLGTGSGAIALAIQHRRPDTRVTAVDASPAALAVARANGERLGLPVRWLLGSWFEPVAGKRFDVIVSNPPYIAADDPHLPALRHEPLSALVARQNGLADLHHLIANAPGHLTAGGWLLLEHGFDQGPAVEAAFTAAATFLPTQQQRDLAGHVRCTGARQSEFA